jgi:hypothetical protein
MIGILGAARRRVAAFCLSQEGNVAILFTLALIPIIGLAGGAIDYNRASSVKTSMQAALDATALAIASQAASLSDSALDEKASEYFVATFNRSDVKNIVIDASYATTGTPALTVTGKGAVDTKFLGILGIDSIPIEAEAKTVWGASRMRIALVLDNTGSMNDAGKIDLLKKASQDLLKTLQAAAQQPDDIQIAIVPFANGVNVGTGNASATWLDWSYYAKSGGGDDDTGTNTWNGDQCGWSSCWQNTGSWNKDATTSSKGSWQGCVMDRDKNYDVLNATPSASNSSTLFPALYEPNCPAPLMPLTYDWTALSNKIDSLIATGSTNQTIGLVWGWHALSPGAPLNAPPLQPNTQRVIVLLTDGVNTENRWTTNSSAIDGRTQQVCSNIKADGITVFTVLVTSGNASLLKNCASDASKFFALSTPDQIAGAFKAIGSNLTKLRLAQ